MDKYVEKILELHLDFVVFPQQHNVLLGVNVQFLRHVFGQKGLIKDYVFQPFQENVYLVLSVIQMKLVLKQVN